MKMEKKWLIPYVVASICLFIGTFFDYQIDAFLYQPNHIFGIVFERYILWLMIVATTFVFTMLRRLHHNFIYLIPEIVCSINAVIEISKYVFPIKDHVFLGCLLVCGVFSFCNMLVYGMPRARLERFEKKGVFFICVLLTAIVITFIIKNFWGRVRFRDLQSMSEFTSWYLPQGMNGNYSFPSGHSTSASAVLSLLVISKQHVKQKVSLPVVIFVYGFIMSMVVARMMMGAHYLSDVAVGFMITYTVFLGYRYYFYRKRYL